MMSSSENNNELLTFGEHLEVLRQMLLRILLLFLVLAIIIFCFKQETFNFLLAPKSNNFITYHLIENFIQTIGSEFNFEAYDVPLISTDLSSQFMSHIYVSCILAILIATPYIIFELFRFISPALYSEEKKYSILFAIGVYAFFALGVIMSYFILFPISFRFLATYQVDPSVISTITLDSYISTFSTLVFLTGILFQLPLIIWILGKLGFVSVGQLKKYRPYALVIIMVIAAVITPPDIFTLLLVTFPIYGLYELSILTIRKYNQ